MSDTNEEHCQDQVVNVPPVNIPGGIPAPQTTPAEMRRLQEAQMRHAAAVKRAKLARRHPEIRASLGNPSDADKQIDDLVDQNKELVAKLDELASDHSRLMTAHEQLQNKHSELSAEAESLRAKLSAIDAVPNPAPATESDPKLTQMDPPVVQADGDAGWDATRTADKDSPAAAPSRRRR